MPVTLALFAANPKCIRIPNSLSVTLILLRGTTVARHGVTTTSCSLLTARKHPALNKSDVELKCFQKRPQFWLLLPEPPRQTLRLNRTNVSNSSRGRFALARQTASQPCAKRISHGSAWDDHVAIQSTATWVVLVHY